MVIVVATGNDGTKYYYGPFSDGEQATSWSYNNLKGFEWHWEDLIRPGTTYMSCKPDDLADFCIPALGRDGECYCTIDGVNWVVEK